MPLSPKLPITDRNVARRAAQLVVTAGFNAARLGAEMRPELTKVAAGTYARRVMQDPMVQAEVEVIMNRTERNAKKFLDLMWDWLEHEGDEVEVGPEKRKVKVLTKGAQEQKVTAARILAKGYISEKPEAPEWKPMVIEGLGNAVGNLIGESVPQKKVM